MCKNPHPLYPCNCDNRTREYTKDFGRIINKDKLPIVDIVAKNYIRYNFQMGQLKCILPSNNISVKNCNNNIYDPVSNSCICKPGYGGSTCQPIECPLYVEGPLVGSSIEAVDGMAIYGAVLQLNCTVEGYLLNEKYLRHDRYCMMNGNWSTDEIMTCSFWCPEDFFAYNESCYWSSQSSNIVGTEEEAEFICKKLDSYLSDLQSIDLALHLRNKYDFGPTSTLIGLKNSSGSLEWSNRVPFRNESNIYWVDSFNNNLPSDKCVHASLCNDSNPLEWYVADCNSLAPFLCQAQRCPSLGNLQNVNLSDFKPEHMFVNGKKTVQCDIKHSIKRETIEQTFECLEEGVWKAEPENCTLHECTNFPYIPHGNRTITSGSVYLGDTAEYVCKPGYHGSYEAEKVFNEKCDLQGWKWDGSAADCDANFYNRTCQEYADNGLNISGYMKIDLDGPDGPLHPFQVFCNFTNQIAITIVQILHNSKNDTNITYNIGFPELNNLKSLSSYCEQELNVKLEFGWLDFSSVYLEGLNASEGYFLDDFVTENICDVPGPHKFDCSSQNYKDNVGLLLGIDRVPVTVRKQNQSVEIEFRELRCFKDIEAEPICGQNSCVNGGTCVPLNRNNGTDEFRCYCAPSYTGPTCSETISCQKDLEEVVNGTWIYSVPAEASQPYKSWARLNCTGRTFVGPTFTGGLFLKKSTAHIRCTKTGNWSNNYRNCNATCPEKFQMTENPQRCLYISQFDNLLFDNYTTAEEYCNKLNAEIISKNISDFLGLKMIDYLNNKGKNNNSQILTSAFKKSSEDSEYIFHPKEDSIILSNGNQSDCVVIEEMNSLLSYLPHKCSKPAFVACEYFECPTPPAQKMNSTLVFSNGVGYLSVIQYKCNDEYEGFNREENITFTCSYHKGQRDWSPQTVTDCQLIDCFTPPYVAGSQYVETTITTTINSTVTYQCDPEFSMQGSPNVTCQKNGNWTTPPFCKRVKCTKPPPVVNSTIIVSNNFTIDSNVSYTCNPGHIHLNGSLERFCLQNGSWSEEAPFYIDCGSPPTIQNSQLLTNMQTYYQSVLNYSCNDHFRFVNNSHTTCLINASWSTLPFCKRVSCPEPPAVLESTRSVNSGPFLIGMQVKYTCNVGRVIRNGDDNRTCQENGSWSGNTPICHLVDCGQPPSTSQATIQHPSHSLGAKAIYTCVEYYSPDSNTSTCLPNDTWSHHPTCYRSHCEPLQSVALTTSIVEGNKIGQRVSYECIRGYNLTQGSAVRFCTNSGSWNGTEPICVDNKCGAPGSGEKSVVHWDNFNLSKIVNWECSTGYVPKSGNETMECTIDGKWLGTPLKCTKRSCGPPPQSFINGTRFSGTYLYQDILSHTCDPGFINVTGWVNMMCLSNGKWSFVDQLCLPDSCNEPETVENSIRKGSFVINETIEYTCDLGFSLKDNYGKRQCQLVNDKLVWSGSVPMCKRSFCGPPATVHMASFNETSFYYKDKVVYICDEGYKLKSGSAVIWCDHQGQWKGELPTCTKKTCRDPGNVTNAIKDGGYLIEETVTYTCGEGYSLIGMASLYCEKTTAWRGKKPFCERVNCSVPASINNADLFFNSTKFMDKIKYVCHEGYTSIDGKVVYLICQANQKWTRPPPVCEKVKCGEPSSSKNAKKYGSQYDYGSKIQYECLEGYNQTDGEKEITCKADTSWSGLPLYCEKMKCPDPEDGENAQKFGEYYYEDVVTYICDYGYILSDGSATRQCLSSLRWSGSPAKCSPIPKKPSGGTDDKATEELSQRDLENNICTPLGDIQGGIRYGLDGYAEVGISIIFRCLENYHFEHDEKAITLKITCKSGGIWDAKLPNCIPAVCPKPPHVPNAITNGPKVHLIGTVWEYRCPTGMIFKEGDFSRIIACMDNKKWSVDASEWGCKLITCIADLKGKKKIIKYMETVWLPCPQNQLHTDGRNGVTSYCRLSGWMHPRAPSCASGRCGPVPMSKNSSMLDIEPAKYAIFVCFDGMRFPDGHRTKTVNCTENGFWEPLSVDPCSPWNCPPPPKVANSTDNKPNRYPMGTKINYECIRHHSFPNKKLSLEILCTKDSKWSTPNPDDCEETFCSTSDFSETLKMNSTKQLHSVDTVLMLWCLNAYLPDGTTEKTIQCLPSSDWSSSSGDCSNARCERPPDVPRSIISTGNVTDIGSVWIYECIKGHKFKNSDAISISIECQLNKSWNDTVPECIEVFCPNPVTIANSNTIYTKKIMGSVATHRCNRGFHLKGKIVKEGVPLQKEINSTCLRNEVWSLDDYWIKKGCEEIQCPHVPIVEFGIPSNLSVKYDNTVVYVCRTGYRISLPGADDEKSLVGSFVNGTNNATEKIITEASIRCDENGIWSGAVPQCVIVHCKDILSESDLMGNTTNTTAWTFVNFTCPLESHFKVNTSLGYVSQTWFVSQCFPTGPTAEWKPTAKDCTDTNNNSEPKEAPNANAYGNIAIAMLTVTFGGLVVVDILTIKKDILTLAHNLHKAFGQGPWSKFLAKNANTVNGPRISTAKLRSILFPGQAGQGPQLGATQNYSNLSNQFLDLRAQ
ncbi:DgyrCDS14317 [Dimorphilus gyrociliatus]|uniref:DgyrCDS14317 n=1 Tax=Dimorphilus gyrociliatus TaxID=2664684 RepID=A0A7I8WD83_9ANNE|nr:DgyrCDS14317 [Dimorphilus gyrociliatus]